jgi:hypothetical protein
VHKTIVGLSKKSGKPAGEDLQAMFEEMMKKFLGEKK